MAFFRPGPLSAEAASRLNALARALEDFLRLRVAPPLQFTKSGGPLISLDGSAFAGGAGITVKDTTGAPTYTGIIEIRTQYIAITNPATGAVLLVPQSAAYNTCGIVNDVDQYLGKGQKTVEMLGIGGTAASSYPRLRRGKLIDESGAITDLHLAITQYQGSAELFGILQSAILSLISADDPDGGLSGRQFATFTNAISSAEVFSRGFAGSGAMAAGGQLPYLFTPSHLIIKANYLASALPTYAAPGFPEIKLGVFKSPDETNQLRQVGIAERWHATQKFSVGTGIGGPYYYGDTGTDPLGNKFAGGICWQVGSTTSIPPTGSAGGDLAGSYPNPTVAKIRGVNVNATSPTSGQVLGYDGTEWIPTTPSGGAPVGAQYVTLATDATLTNERVLTGEASVVSITDGGAGGNVTIGIATDGISTAKIANNAVTNAKSAQMAAYTIKGNNTGGLANASDLTATQTTAMLDVFTPALKGLVPASGGGTANFLRADGTFAPPTTTGSSLPNIIGDTHSNGLTTAIGTGITRVEAVLPVSPVNIFAGPGYTPTGLAFVIPSTGRYDFVGKIRMSMTAGAGGASFMVGAIFRNGVVIESSPAIYLAVLGAGANWQDTVPLHCQSVACTAGDLITVQANWQGAALAASQVVSDANGQTELTARRMET
jgi:hypothetical protein